MTEFNLKYEDLKYHTFIIFKYEHYDGPYAGQTQELAGAICELNDKGDPLISFMELPWGWPLNMLDKPNQPIGTERKKFRAKLSDRETNIERRQNFLNGMKNTVKHEIEELFVGSGD